MHTTPPFPARTPTASQEKKGSGTGTVGVRSDMGFGSRRSCPELVPVPRCRGRGLSGPQDTPGDRRPPDPSRRPSGVCTTSAPETSATSSRLSCRSGSRRGVCGHRGPWFALSVRYRPPVGVGAVVGPWVRENEVRTDRRLLSQCRTLSGRISTPRTSPGSSLSLQTPGSPSRVGASYSSRRVGTGGSGRRKDPTLIFPGTTSGHEGRRSRARRDSSPSPPCTGPLGRTRELRGGAWSFVTSRAVRGRRERDTRPARTASPSTEARCRRHCRDLRRDAAQGVWMAEEEEEPVTLTPRVSVRPETHVPRLSLPPQPRRPSRLPPDTPPSPRTAPRGVPQSRSPSCPGSGRLRAPVVVGTPVGPGTPMRGAGAPGTHPHPSTTLGPGTDGRTRRTRPHDPTGECGRWRETHLPL